MNEYKGALERKRKADARSAAKPVSRMRALPVTFKCPLSGLPCGSPCSVNNCVMGPKGKRQ